MIAELIVKSYCLTSISCKWGSESWSDSSIKCLLECIQEDFYPLGVVSGVFATATWLARWLGGWMSHAGIVSKRLNLSENFFNRLKAPSF